MVIHKIMETLFIIACLAILVSDFDYQDAIEALFLNSNGELVVPCSTDQKCEDLNPNLLYEEN